MNTNLILETASSNAKDLKNIFGGFRSLYKRAAIVASQKLSRNITEYDIAAIQMSYVEAMLSMNKNASTDGFELYPQLARLAAMMGEFSVLTTSDNFTDIILTDVESDIADAVNTIKAVAGGLPKAETFPGNTESV